MAEQKEDKSMKAGRVSQTVYRRSVLKQIQNNIEGIDFLRPSQEETCYIADESEERITIATDVSLAGNEKDLGVFAIAQAVDQLASRGARAYGISVRIMLPTFAYESRLKAMMMEISEICKEKGLRVFFADAQSVNGIQTSIVHVTAHGEAKKADRQKQAKRLSWLNGLVWKEPYGSYGKKGRLWQSGLRRDS